MPEYLTLSQAAQIMPGRPHRNTIARWMTRGYAGVKLASWRCGHRSVTTKQAIEDFIRAITGAEPSAPEPSAAHLRAEAELDAMGVC